ncbi:hypothetical protein DDT91_14330 [Algoriphagus sp. AK58]|nr:hypothetical protein [Algoriphagus sp. AK58]
MRQPLFSIFQQLNRKSLNLRLEEEFIGFDGSNTCLKKAGKIQIKMKSSFLIFFQLFIEKNTSGPKSFTFITTCIGLVKKE